MNFLRPVMRRAAMLSTVRTGYFLTVAVLTRHGAISIIRTSSLAPLFGPSLRRALTFLGPGIRAGRRPTRGARDVPTERLRRKRMPRRDAAALLPLNVANRCAIFVSTADSQVDC